MSFNIRGEIETDGTNSWSMRYVAVAMMLEDTSSWCVMAGADTPWAKWQAAW